MSAVGKILAAGTEVWLEVLLGGWIALGFSLALPAEAAFASSAFVVSLGKKRLS